MPKWTVIVALAVFMAGAAGSARAASPAAVTPAAARHFSQFITHIRDRGFPAVDEERGLVPALGFFDHAGRMQTQTLADGKVSAVPADMQVPFTFQIAELFKIQDGKIRSIEALVIPAPHGMRAGWPQPRGDLK